MFPLIEAFGKRIDREYAGTRAKWERLYEATQTKGDGEAHPFLSPNDEFADFERWDKGNLDGSVPKKNEMLEFEYARSGLKTGLKLERDLGTNPYKFGMIGSSDAHTGLAAMEEDNFFGKTTPQEPSPERLNATFVNNAETGVKIMDWEVLASGYAAVWASENTREALWDAMQRKETYATTGTRMALRRLDADPGAKEFLRPLPNPSSSCRALGGRGREASMARHDERELSSGRER